MAIYELAWLMERHSSESTDKYKQTQREDPVNLDTTPQPRTAGQQPKNQSHLPVHDAKLPLVY